MSIDTLLAIIGIIATIGIGYIGVIYTIKFRNRVRITFLKQECISLFRDIVERVDDIEISLNKKPISQNVILFKGTFLNSGNTDIDKNSMYESLSVVLPKNYKWLKLNSKNKSQNINLSYQIKDERNIEFCWDLLKKGEFFEFDALVEYVKQEVGSDKINNVNDISNVLYEELKFTHRITNLLNIEKGELPAKTKPSRRFLVFYWSQLSILIAFVIIFLLKPEVKYRIGYEAVKNDKKYELELKPLNKEKIELNIDALNTKETISIDKFNKAYDINLKINNNTKGITSLIIAIAGVIIVLVLYYGWILYEYRKSKRLIKMIKNYNINYTQ